MGNDERDDAAVYDLGDGTGVISTTDFFMPIVDDAYDFGRIAAVNSLSDVWAMGGKPLMAVAILGWPIKALPPDLANQVVEGARAACRSAGVVLAGGHSVDNPEPLFGLAVTGRVDLNQLKRNSTAQVGDVLVLTKPIGTGILTTALKKGILQSAHSGIATETMLKDNRVGARLGELAQVHAMTDITGFGLLGHAHEMALGARAEIALNSGDVPLLGGGALWDYVRQGAVPGGSNRNWDSYGHQVRGLDGAQHDLKRAIMCDPQTAGGLLVSVAPAGLESIESILTEAGNAYSIIGRVRQGTAGQVTVDTGAE